MLRSTPCANSALASQKLMQSLQIRHEVVYIIVSIFWKQSDVGFGGIVDCKFHGAYRPGAIASRRVSQCDSEFVLISQFARDRLPGGKSHAHLRPRPTRIEQALLEFQP